MENREDTVRMKGEPNDDWLDEGDDYVFDPVDSCQTENFNTLLTYIHTVYKLSTNHMNEDMAFGEMLDNKVFIDFECKDVKPKLSSLSTINCKSEDQSYSQIVKLEKPIQAKYLNDKDMIILIRKEFNYENNRQFPFNFRLSCGEPKEVKLFRKKGPY